MFSDLKFASRSLLKSPGFTVVAILTLTLGIGATTAIFSVVNTVLLKPLPYAQPDKLARIYTEFPAFKAYRSSSNIPEYLDLHRETSAWEAIEAWMDLGVNIGTAAGPTRTTASFVTGGMFRTLGVTAMMGRGITPNDGELGAPSVAVISQSLWQRAFAGNSTVIGEDILLNGRKHTVIGVMPASFDFPLGKADKSEMWVPLQIDSANAGPRESHYLHLLGRLKAHLTLRQAQAELNLLVKQWGQTGSGHHFDPKDHSIITYALHDEVAREVKPALKMLFGAVCLLLLIACMNVANLLLVRAEARQREIAIRGALGAGLWRLGRQFATEGVLLSLTGTACGLLLAYAGLGIIRFATESSIPRAIEAGIDGRVMLFAVALSILTGLVFGLAPLVHVIRRNLHNAMKSAAASTTDGAGAQLFRQTLVVSQLALALVLLIGTGLMLRAFWKLQAVDPGFDTRSVVTMSVGLPDVTVSSAQHLWRRLEERLNTVPGAEAVALATDLPTTPSLVTSLGTTIEGVVPSQGGPAPLPEFPNQYSVDFYRSINNGYFDTLRIHLLEGRVFDERDGPLAPKVAVINQTMARTFWGNRPAVGQRLRGGGEDEWRTVVGVVADVKNNGLAQPTATEIYFPYAQPAPTGLGSLSIAIRSRSEPSVVVSAVRRELKQIDPRLPLIKVRTMDEAVSASQSRPRFLALLLTVFAIVSVVLAAIGIYGVISYSVAQRTREFGIRMALGAQRGTMLRMVLGRGALLTVCGVLIGFGGALALTRFLSGLLFGVTVTDPATFVVVSLLLSAIAVLASYIPARRATRVDPMIALRAE